MKQELPRTGEITVTPEMARQWRHDWHFDRQRPIRPIRVETLAREMRAERFLQGTAIHIGVVERRCYIMNGNHTLDAIVHSGLDQRLALIVLNYATMEELGRAYTKFDQHGARQIRDSITAVGLDREIEADPQFVRAATGAMALRITEFAVGPGRKASYLARSHHMRMEAVREYRDRIKDYFMAVCSRDMISRSKLLRATVMAVALETLRYQPERGKIFWDRVATDDGLRKGDPAKALINYLLANKATSGTRARDLRAVALCWNADWDGRQIKQLKPTTLKEFILSGTPWKEGARPPALHCVQREEKIQQSNLVSLPARKARKA